MVSSQLSQLQAACNAAHARYQATRMALAAAVNKSPDDEIVGDIIGSTEEYGLNTTIKRVKTSDPKVAAAIENLVAASADLDIAVSDRERYLIIQNPNHNVAFVSDGREYHLDFEKSTITWLDNPSQPEKVDIQKLNKLPDYDIIELE